MNVLSQIAGDKFERAARLAIGQHQRTMVVEYLSQYASSLWRNVGGKSQVEDDVSVSGITVTMRTQVVQQPREYRRSKSAQTDIDGAFINHRGDILVAMIGRGKRRVNRIRTSSNHSARHKLFDDRLLNPV